MMRNVMILAFVASVVLLFCVAAVAGGPFFVLPLLVLYWVAFLVMALGVYASTQFWSVDPKLVYGTAVLVTAVFMVVFLSWMSGNSLKELQEVRFLAAVLGPFLVANAGAYWLVAKNKI